MGYPSLGSWVTYGLGSVSDNLPAYCVLPQPEGTPEGGAPCWGAGFLPAVYQGTLLRKGPNPILNLQAARRRRARAAAAHARPAAAHERDRPRPRRHRAGGPHRQLRTGLPDAAARPGGGRSGAGDRRRPEAAYGLDDKRTRRLRHAAAAGSRGWSSAACASCRSTPAAARWSRSGTPTTTSTRNHEKMCGHVDQPIAALLKDLKQRGLLETTLVVWCSEFGRTPMSQGGKGRDHNPLRLHDVAGRRRRQGRHRRSARPTSSACKAVDEPHQRQRLPRDDPAPARPGSREADVSGTTAATSA